MQLLPTNRTVERLAAPSGSGAAKGMEFALVIVTFFGIGALLDWAIGTKPWLTLVVGFLGIVGQFLRIWYAYDAEMQGHEDRLRQGRSS